MPFLYFRSSALIALACLVSHASGHKHYYDDHEEHFSHFHHDGAVHDHRELSGVERCSTPVLSPGQRYEDNQKVAAWRKSNGCTIDSCPMLEAFPETTISVYWHSMQTSSGTGGITTQMITDSMSVLNAAYAASGFSFALMQTTVTDNDDYYYSLAGPKATAMKTALRQGDASTLNIYSTGIDTISSALGSATFPSEYASEPLEDGVVIGSNTAPGGNKAPYNRGNTLVHEVGHWMGLLHVFSGGCEGGGCDGVGGDSVSDTPPQDEPSYGCPVGKDTCDDAGVDSIENFMDYSDDDCMTAFTAGQNTRMQEQWNTYRAGGMGTGCGSSLKTTVIKNGLNALAAVSNFFN